MADKLISDLTASGALLSTGLFETEPAAGPPTMPGQCAKFQRGEVMIARLIFALLFLCLPLWAQTVTYRALNPTQLGSNNFTVTIKDGVLLTNKTSYGLSTEYGLFDPAGPHYAYFSLINPNPTATTANFDFTSSVFHMGTTPRSNVVFKSGYNALREVVGEASFYTALETHWGPNGAAPNFEWYLETFGTNGFTHRPIAVTSPKSGLDVARVDLIGSVYSGGNYFAIESLGYTNLQASFYPWAGGGSLASFYGAFGVMPFTHSGSTQSGEVDLYSESLSVGTRLQQVGDNLLIGRFGAGNGRLIISGHTNAVMAGTFTANVINTINPGFKATGTNNMILTCPNGGSWILRVDNLGVLTTVTNSSGL